MEFCCPLCDRPFSPDQVSASQPVAECTACRRSVLLGQRDDSDDARSLAWPREFAITEVPPPEGAPAQIGDGLYRAHEIVRRPGLAITQQLPRDGHGLLARAIVTSELVVATIVALAAGAAHAVAVAFAGALIVLLWGLVTARHKRRTFRADPQGLHWHRVAWTTQLRDRTLSASDVAQLYVRNTARLTDTWLPRFTLYARDRAGRDHAITDFDTPEQAWWLEDRLEGHLGLVGRAIASEYRRQALPAGR